MYNIKLLILKHFKDKLRENVYWILQLRDIRSDGGHYEHSNKFLDFTKGRVFINQVRDYGLFEKVVLRSEILFHSPLHGFSLCYSHPQEFVCLVTT